MPKIVKIHAKVCLMYCGRKDYFIPVNLFSINIHFLINCYHFLHNLLIVDFKEKYVNIRRSLYYSMS